MPTKPHRHVWGRPATPGDDICTTCRSVCHRDANGVIDDYTDIALIAETARRAARTAVTP